MKGQAHIKDASDKDLLLVGQAHTGCGVYVCIFDVLRRKRG
jgi:hypothetical protein